MKTSTRRLPPILPSVLLLGLALVASACSGGSSPSGSPGASQGASQAPGGGGPVDATGDWRLVGGTSGGVDVPTVAGSDITMTVAGSEISGRSACNQYGGEIVVENGQIRFGPLFMTEMACAEPVMASEAAYHAALAGVRSATRDGDRLTLSGDGVELVYERLAPVPAADLVETDWVLDSLITGDAVSSVAGDPATLRLGADGSVTGSTGCRAFTGRYVIANAEVAMTDMAMDGSVCPPELAAQDGHVVTVLGDGFRAVVDGEHLTLTASGSEGLGYMTVLPEIPPAP